jgi:hypothetical protein
MQMCRCHAGVSAWPTMYHHAPLHAELCVSGAQCVQGSNMAPLANLLMWAYLRTPELKRQAHSTSCADGCSWVYACSTHVARFAVDTAHRTPVRLQVQIANGYCGV